MTNPVAITRTWETSDGKLRGKKLFLWCPGCKEVHAPEVENRQKRWDWNNDLVNVAIAPSLLVNGNPDMHNPGRPRCHSFIRDGHWEFLGDCTHELAGQRVPLVPLPDWIANMGKDIRGGDVG